MGGGFGGQIAMVLIGYGLGYELCRWRVSSGLVLEECFGVSKRPFEGSRGPVLLERSSRNNNINSTSTSDNNDNNIHTSLYPSRSNKGCMCLVLLSG